MNNIKAKTWVEINQANLEFNLKQFRSKIGEQVSLMSVVKSNAYGHNAGIIAKISEKYADFHGVDSIFEALSLKEQGISKPILILGYTLFDNLELVVKNNFHQVVANPETLETIGELSTKFAQKAFIHLKIETGTNRQGIFFQDLDKILELFDQYPRLELAGVSTHFANIEDTTDHTYAMEQLEKYKQAIKYIELKGFKNFIKHTACSAATILFPETYFDLVRVGISLYGLWSSTETLVSAKQKDIDFNLKPILTWKTKVAQIKTLPAGSCISYGCTEKVEEPTKIAILPIGYWDGYDRKLSSIGNVLIQGKQCKIMGRVCMNMIIVNVNHLSDVKLEDEVVLLGQQNGQEITAEEIANKIGTINYEVVTRINPLIKRIVV